MKKTAFIIIAFFAFVSASLAQEKAKKTPEQKAEEQTQKWTKVLSLTTEQVPKVKSILLDRAQKVQAIKAKYPSEADKNRKQQEIKNVKAEADKALKLVLTPEQYATYVKTKEEKKKDKDKNKNKDNDSDSSEE